MIKTRNELYCIYMYMNFINFNTKRKKWLHFLKYYVHMFKFLNIYHIFKKCITNEITSLCAPILLSGGLIHNFGLFMFENFEFCSYNFHYSNEI